MAEARKKPLISTGLAAQNRKARYDYKIGETIEAGIVLVGPEVKSLRAGRASLQEAWAGERDGEIWLFNCHIPEWQAGSFMAKFEPTRPRKLLLHKKQVQSLAGRTTREGATIVPLEIRFNEKGRAKVLLGMAEGKKQHDKRAAIAERDWQRDKARMMRNKGQE
jgi:SsrA-binding protein